MTAFASAMQQQFRGGAAEFHAASARSKTSALLLWAYSVEKLLLISARLTDSISLLRWEIVAMLGPRQEAQSALFYDFYIEEHVPTDHVLRAIDGIIDLSGVRAHLAQFYSSTGRPSIDPELMMRMLLVGYIMGIRSERRLCDEVHLNLAYRWFCKLDLIDAIPDHSTFSKNRHGRFRDSDLLRHVFENVVAQCIESGLASGQRYAADASIIAADANRQKSTSKADWDPERIDREDAPRAVRKYLNTLDDAAFGAASPVVPKFISHSDPASQWSGARGGPAFLLIPQITLLIRTTQLLWMWSQRALFDKRKLTRSKL